jgi:hypothetical protein
MSKVITTITYTVKPEARAAYERHITQLKALLIAAGKNYGVFEVEGKKNQFMEMFVTATVAEYEAIEDGMTPEMETLISQVGTLVDKGGMKYTTYCEQF